ncbi:MAG: UV damage endonuclease UvsE, partial [Phormidesmis sp. CAN_BIN36]|nr:UV damage endonuclease UvsE [Phormidesmis sp. CAN_BIN36]
MVPELGLVCITASKAVRYRTVTRKRLFQFDSLEQARMLRDLYADNLRRLEQAIEFCNANQIRLYRLSSALFPFADDVIGEKVLEEFEAEIGLVGDRASHLNIRLVLHPDQFVVLSSDRPEVIENSIKILKTHAHILDLL